VGWWLLLRPANPRERADGAFHKLEPVVIPASMPQEPLSAAFAAILRSDAVAALAAAFILHQPFRRFARVASTMTEGEQSPKPHGAGNGAVRKRRGGDHRREARDRDDEALVAAMRATSGASIDWAGKIGKSRTSVVTALHRLKDAGLAESSEGKWLLVEAPPRGTKPSPRWFEPLKATDRAAHALLTAS
jgi:biotin operon repressor